jgi:hypothetical protein
VLSIFYESVHNSDNVTSHFLGVNRETSSKWLDSVIALQDIIPLLANILRLFTDQLKTNQSVKSAHSCHIVPTSCALASGQCLYALTEDHPKLSKRLAFSDESAIQPIIALSSTSDQQVKHFSSEDNENIELLKVVSIGILRNIILHSRKRAEELSFKPAYDENMPHILIVKLKVDLGQLAAEAAEAHNSIVSADHVILYSTILSRTVQKKGKNSFL